MTKQFEFDLGSEVRDTVSGLVGVVTCNSIWRFGCTRICVQPKMLHEGKPVEGVWIDEQQLVLVAETVDKPLREFPAGPRGDQKGPVGAY